MRARRQKRVGVFPLVVLMLVLILVPVVTPAGVSSLPGEPDAEFPVFGPAAAERFARLALSCVGREYPNKISHVLQGDADLAPPRQLTPAFCGCFDWHSAVHAHWLLVRLVRLYPRAGFAGEARSALAHSLTAPKIAAEVAYLRGKGRETFERPYGLAWLLQLCAELREWDDSQARSWVAILQPLEGEAAGRFVAWLPKLRYPIRTGEHSQTAFALGLVLDWSLVACRADDEGIAAVARQLTGLVTAKARAFHLEDRGCNLAFEPSGQDFLSPCLAEADLMRRVLPAPAFARWLGEFLPDIPGTEGTPAAAARGAADWLPVAEVTDRADGKLAHLDGLNLSRAWMLEGITSGLPVGDPRLPALRAAAAAHRRAGLAAVTGEHYAGGHWLGSFAVYLVTGRGRR